MMVNSQANHLEPFQEIHLLLEEEQERISEPLTSKVEVEEVSR